MRSRVRAFRAIVPVVAASSLLIAACGGDDDSSSSTDPAEQEDELRPPVAVEAIGDGMGAATEMSAEADATDSRDADPTDSFLPVFGGFEYALGEGMPPLPTNAIGYEYPAGVDIAEATVIQLAQVFGVEGEPQRFEEGESIARRVGPDDGSAPSLWVSADGQGNWSYSAAWGERPLGVACAEPGVTSIAPASDVPVSEVPVSEVPASDVPVSELPVEECVEPEPPAGVPSAAEAEQRAGELLKVMGVDASTYEFETFADDWFASVNAMPVLDGVRSPIGTGFGFGADGVLEWASGSLATPIATGPYPLVDLDAAVARLAEQGGLGYGVLTGGAVADSSVASEDAAVDEAVESSKSTETVVPPEESVLPPESQPLPTEPVEPAQPVVPPEIVVAVLVDVNADFWWVFDASGSTWLLPAYTFTDTEGRTHTVPAVTDEYLIQEAPVGIEPLPPEQVDPPSDVTVPGDEVVVGLTVDEATARLDELGLSLRVARQDGEDLAVTEDYVPTRINVAVDDGIVTEVLFVG